MVYLDNWYKNQLSGSRSVCNSLGPLVNFGVNAIFINTQDKEDYATQSVGDCMNDEWRIHAQDDHARDGTHECKI